MSDYLIREYTTTDGRLVRVYPDDDYGPDPLKDEYLAPEIRQEMHDMWVAGEVYRTEVFEKDIKLLDYERGVGVEFTGGFFGEDGPESYYPNIGLYEVEPLMENSEYHWSVLYDFQEGKGWTKSKEFFARDEMEAFLDQLKRKAK